MVSATAHRRAEARGTVPRHPATIHSVQQQPQLFDVPGLEPAAAARAALRRSGVIEAAWEVGWGQSTETWSGGAVDVFRWSRGPLLIELALGPLVPTLTDGWAVNESWIGVFRWRVEPGNAYAHLMRWPIRMPGLTCALTCPLGGSGDPETGECLEAQTWDRAGTRISIGTEDSDALCARARGAHNLPKAWARHLCLFSEHPERARAARYPVKYLPHGLALELPPLRRGAQAKSTWRWQLSRPLVTLTSLLGTQ